MTDRVGQQLGNYRLVTLLGQGGYAAVYLGQHVRFKQQAAIKVLHTHLSAQEAEHFLHEAETIAALAHPSIVRVFDFDVQDGVPFLVMDYAPNGSLRRRYPKGQIVPLPHIISSVKQVAAALQYAHQQKFIHRDVKPENMLLGRHEEVLLSDFGLAALSHSSGSLSTKEAVGTLPYMAPEQIEGHPRAASDQYALGVVVYEWLCGARPFEGSLTEVMVQHLTMPPPPLHEKVATIPLGIEQVVLRALAKDPKQRFASVQDFATALYHAAHPAGYASITTPAVLITSAATPGERTATEPFWKIPTILTPLVGREQDVASICTTLSRPDVRLLTLLGVGGIGKTRLSIQVATELRERFTDGVCFVGLAPISDPSLVISSVAHELGLQEAGAHPLVETVKAWLRDKQFLLLLDNFEQIVSAAPLLEDLLAVCPRLVILVTSREVLRLSAEHLFPVPSLTLPDLTRLTEQEGLGQYAAVSLFLQRAQALKSDFQLIPTNAHAIAEICVRLDGLPLAIELAAARIRLLPPQALLTRLAKRLQVLTSGSRTLPARQQTLRNTIQWSYDLLNTQEQRLFRWLSVFVGGCALEAAEAVYGSSSDASDSIGSSVLDGVTSLIDKSLLYQTEQEGEEPRVTMLETIREYGLEALAASREMEATRAAHAYYFFALAEEAALNLAGPRSTDWLQRFEREHDNLRAALAWSLEPAQTASSPDLALRFCTTLREFWDVRGFYNEGRAFLEQALAHCEGASTSVRASALGAAAAFADCLGDIPHEEDLWQESLVLYRELGDTRGIASSFQGLAWVHSRKGASIAALQLLEKSVTLLRELGDKAALAWSLSNLADKLCEQGEYSRANALFEEILTLFRDLGNKRGIAQSLQQSALWLLMARGDQATIHARLEEMLTLHSELGNKSGMAQYYWISGWVAFSRGDAATAQALMEQSLALWQEMGDWWHAFWPLAALGRIEASQGDLAAALAFHQQSLAVVRELDDERLSAYCLEGWASAVAIQGKSTWAARLWGAAESLRERCVNPLTPYERVYYEPEVAAARTHLGEQEFTTAWAEGRAMTLEQALVAPE